METTIFLEGETFYHIFNRGVNKDNIFRAESDYDRFFSLWEKYIDPIAETYAYCLLSNHFHYLLKIKNVNDLRKIPAVSHLTDDQIALFLSHQFSNFFNAYAKYFNIKYGRVGKLFCARFKRKEIDSVEYFNAVLEYIHLNPQKHRLVDDYKEYEYSSYGVNLRG